MSRPSFDVETRLGLNVGYETGVIRAHSDAVGSTLQTIWFDEDLIPFPSAPAIMALASADATDTAGDVGAHAVRVFALDENYDPFEETVVLNGQTPVSMQKAAFRINELTVVASGTSKRNAGNIYIADAGDTWALGVPDTPYNGIEAGWGTSHTGIFTVPRTKSLLITSWSANVQSNAVVDAQLEVLTAGSDTWWRFIELQHTDGFSSFLDAIGSPLIREKSDIQITGSIAAGPASSKVTFLTQYYLFDPDGTDNPLES